MSDQIFRHEYTWSESSITGGGRPGWGITASSLPKERRILTEMEKIAAQIPADHAGGRTIEGLSYSPVCGFVRAFSTSCDFGKDRRQNKVVRIYQMGDEEDPDSYLAPLPAWEEAENDGLLAPVEKERADYDLTDLIRRTGGHLPSLLSRVYRCILDGNAPLNLYGESIRDPLKLMALIHLVLPPCLRRSAGFLSAGQPENGSMPFFFSEEPAAACTWSPEEEGSKDPDPMAEFFFKELADACTGQSGILPLYFHKADRFLTGTSDTTNLLPKLEWIYYSLYRERGGEPLSFDLLTDGYPRLLHWGTEDEICAASAATVREDILSYDPDLSEKCDYLMKLFSGITAGTKETVLAETDWILYGIYEEDTEEWKRQMEALCDRNASLSLEMARTSSGHPDQYQHMLTAYCERYLKKKKGRRQSKASGTEERKRRETMDHMTAEAGQDRNSPDQNLNPKERKRRKKTDRGSAIPAQAQVREIEDAPMGPLLATSIPQGFLTGCVMFLAWYAVRIGHWKISIGLGGMWLLILLNYIYLLYHRKESYPLWEIIGICLLEGLIIQAVAWFLPTKLLRLYYFLILGIITVLAQLINIFRQIRARRYEVTDHDTE